MRNDGTFGKFDTETGKITTVVFNPATDKFEVEDYKTPEGIAAIKQRFASGMAGVLAYAEEFGDTDICRGTGMSNVRSTLLIATPACDRKNATKHWQSCTAKTVSCLTQ